MIGSIVLLAIKKCAADISPYVRKAAALAIPKLHKSVLIILFPYTSSRVTLPQLGFISPTGAYKSNIYITEGSIPALAR